MNWTDSIDYWGRILGDAWAQAEANRAWEEWVDGRQ